MQTDTDNLNTLEIKILLSCSKGVFTKSALSQISKQKYSLIEKQKAVRKLIIQDLLIEKALPKIGSKKTPVFYSLTEAGKKWVKEYSANYPKT